MATSREISTASVSTEIAVVGSVAERAYLVVIEGPAIGSHLELGDEKVTIGRSPECDLALDHPSVSRVHCLIGRGGWRGAPFYVHDLSSTNGTWVNETRPRGEARLEDGDLIKIGQAGLKFLSSSNLEAQYHEEMYRLMTTDGLTRLFNRRYFDEVLEREVARCRRYERTFSLVLFDIDHFKAINDQHGHAAGDAVLRQLSENVTERLRHDDFFARLGGEEFGVLLPELDLEGAVGLAEELRQLVATTPFRCDGAEIPVTVSLGVAEWQADLDTPERIVELADSRLYQAKMAGRNRVGS